MQTFPDINVKIISGNKILIEDENILKSISETENSNCKREGGNNAGTGNDTREGVGEDADNDTGEGADNDTGNDTREDIGEDAGNLESRKDDNLEIDILKKSNFTGQNIKLRQRNIIKKNCKTCQQSTIITLINNIPDLCSGDIGVFECLDCSTVKQTIVTGDKLYGVIGGGYEIAAFLTSDSSSIIKNESKGLIERTFAIQLIALLFLTIIILITFFIANIVSFITFIILTFLAILVCGFAYYYLLEDFSVTINDISTKVTNNINEKYENNQQEISDYFFDVFVGDYRIPRSNPCTVTAPPPICPPCTALP